MATQRAHGRLIATWRAPKAEIDTTGVERIERAELLGNHQRRMVRQHHAAGAQMQSGGMGGKIANQHRGRGAGNTDHIMVLGQPVAMITAFFRQLRQI